MIERGDIRWFRFDHPDKRRPVLVVGLIPERAAWLDRLSCRPGLADIGTDLLAHGYHQLRELCRRFRLGPVLRTLARDPRRSATDRAVP